MNHGEVMAPRPIPSMQTLDLAATVFGVIFIAELPDKTALAALVLATRHKALPVFVGAALALTVQSLLAVAAGSVFFLLPARAVRLGAGSVFLVSACVMWLRKTAEAQEPREATTLADSRGFWRTAAMALGVVFVAEWGDLTQFATAAFAAREHATLVVFGAATLALWAVAAIAVAIGSHTAKLLSPKLLQKIAALLFAAIGLALVFGWL
jgi:Ca2+/H+ antiporter, TMEM165/GDT1 family